MPMCKTGCGRTAAAGRKDFCNGCYRKNYVKQSDRPCLYCGRPSLARDMCAAHLSREKRGYDMTKPLVPRYADGLACIVPDCSTPPKKLGLCHFHYSRQRKGTTLTQPKRVFGKPWNAVNTHGYRNLYNVAPLAPLPAFDKILEHRYVMATLLGRPLFDHESVHHRNGDRLDNRPENLELWSSHQPSGQRIEDRVRWAREVLALYGQLVP